jgi:myo-inositol 2-dehydrogenase/D-chiro-inositol 1-dehydrogenase
MSAARAARLAFIGCGRHATRLLYPCLPSLAEIDLVAVCDLDADLARTTARNFGARRWYTAVDDLLAQEGELDGAIVVGPPQMMAAVGRTVLERRGLPIFVEKPPAATLAEAQRLAAAAAMAGTWGMVGFMRRFAVAYRLARQAMTRPHFGPVSFLDVKFSNGEWGPRLGIEPPAVSFLTGQAIHIFDLIHLLAGPPREVYAKYLERTPTQYAFAVTLSFENGALATLNLNALEAWDSFHEWVSISGLHHYVIVENMLKVQCFPNEHWRPGFDDRGLRNTQSAWELTGPTAPDLREIMGYRDELREFARCILEGRRPEPDLAAGVAALRLGQAVWASAQTGRAIDLAGWSPADDGA